MEETINLIRIITGQSFRDISAMFKALLQVIIVQYSTGKPVPIPFIGDLLVRHTGETLDKKGLEAKVNVFLSASKELKRAVGEYKDVEEDENFENLPIFKQLNKEIETYLKNQVQ